MPKKHNKSSFTKPPSTPHHTLTSSGPRNNQNGFRSSQASSATEQPSVNDLINHLRRSQVSSPADDTSRSPSRFVATRSVHPSLRNLLELPETPPPRPRPDARRAAVGPRRLRRTPGPPPPESWLLGNHALDQFEGDMADSGAAGIERVIFRLDRLPGVTFPAKRSMLHMVLKSMALHWVWHLEYDGQFLAVLPSTIKMLLLSYIAIYARDQPLRRLMQGFRPLIEKHRPDAPVDDSGDEIAQGQDIEITRLDLSHGVGRWISWKQLTGELILPKPAVQQEPSPSWEDEIAEEEGVQSHHDHSILKAPTQGLRFNNLRYLSLAHPNQSAADWNALINLLSRLSTITHLSLAHWPVPTVTPNAMNARVRHPTNRSLTFAYSGTDAYSASENNWAEAAGLMRKLSRVTYCLKWLDLEGCSDWIPALTWDGVGPDGEAYATGPEWNRSWRDIEFVRLGPGWLPHLDDSELSLPSSSVMSSTPSSSSQAMSRSLALSAHAPAASVGEHTLNQSTDSDLPWDVEVERIKYRRMKELEQYRDAVQAAKAVQQRVINARTEGKGKWVQFSFGLEGVDEDVLRQLLGKEYWTFLP